MYDTEYEYDAMACLRLLKYIQVYKPRKVSWMTPKSFNCDDMLLFLYENLWEVVDEIDEVYDDETGILEGILFTDRTFNDFIHLSCELNASAISVLDAARKRLEDTIYFFFNNRLQGVYGVEVLFHHETASIQLFLDENYCEPEDMTFALTDLLIYLHRANERMQKQLEERNGKIITLPQNTLEEAA